MITREDWLAAQEEARRPLMTTDPGVVTKVELAAILGLQKSATHRWILKMEARGLVTRTMKNVKRADGRYTPTPAYRLTRPEVVADAVHEPRRPHPRRRRRARLRRSTR